MPECRLAMWRACAAMRAVLSAMCPPWWKRSTCARRLSYTLWCVRASADDPTDDLGDLVGSLPGRDMAGQHKLVRFVGFGPPLAEALLVRDDLGIPQVGKEVLPVRRQIPGAAQEEVRLGQPLDRVERAVAGFQLDRGVAAHRVGEELRQRVGLFGMLGVGRDAEGIGE